MFARCFTDQQGDAGEAEHGNHDRVAAEWVRQSESSRATQSVTAAVIEASETVRVAATTAAQTQNGERRRARNQDEDRAGPGCHALAAAEPEVDREQVPEERAECDPDPKRVREGRGRREPPAAASRVSATGTAPLAKSRAKTSKPILAAEDAADVGGPDVAAAGVEEVDAASAGDEVAERDGADQVGGDESDDGEDHVDVDMGKTSRGEGGARLRAATSSNTASSCR